jgi:hypothetical protein
MSQEQIPDHRTPDTSIRLLKLHARRSARLLPKNGIFSNRTLPPAVMKILRDNLAAELRELRTYPDHVTLAEARQLEMTHLNKSDERDTMISEERTKNA